MLVAGAFVYTLIAIIEAITQDNLGFLVTLPFKNTAFLTAVLYQGIGCSILAFFMSNVAIANIGVNRNASLIGISTVVSIIAGVVFMHESFTAYQLVGEALRCASGGAAASGDRRGSMKQSESRGSDISQGAKSLPCEV